MIIGSSNLHDVFPIRAPLKWICILNVSRHDPNLTQPPEDVKLYVNHLWTMERVFPIPHSASSFMVFRLSNIKINPCTMDPGTLGKEQRTRRRLNDSIGTRSTGSHVWFYRIMALILSDGLGLSYDQKNKSYYVKIHFEYFCDGWRISCMRWMMNMRKFQICFLFTVNTNSSLLAHVQMVDWW